jgi:hypothetical protein
MARFLRFAGALPSLRALLLCRGLTSIDNQAIAFSLALAAYGSVSQSRATARLARRRQFFIHLVDLVGVDLKMRALGGGQSTEGPNAITHPTINVSARNKLPKSCFDQGGGKRRGDILSLIEQHGSGIVERN